jgi:hypothetical protein
MEDQMWIFADNGFLLRRENVLFGHRNLGYGCVCGETVVVREDMPDADAEFDFCEDERKICASRNREI